MGPKKIPSQMEKPSSTTEPPPPPMLAAESPSTQPAQDPSSRGRKRAPEGNLRIDNSNYYKMRLLLKDLRPHVLEVLRTPDFRDSKAAIEIQEKMKLMLQLHQEMMGETPRPEKTTKTESLSNGKAINQTPQSSTRSPETSSVQTDMHNSDGDGGKVVGGSAFGWNFTTCGAAEAVYSGMSKEEYRSSHPIIQPEPEVELECTTTHDK